LAKIKEVIEHVPGARLILISRRGHYTYSAGNETVQTTDIPLLGTFVEFEVVFGETEK
jgi:hypothetical protein